MSAGQTCSGEKAYDWRSGVRLLISVDSLDNFLEQFYTCFLGIKWKKELLKKGIKQRPFYGHRNRHNSVNANIGIHLM